ncbi:histidine kinase [Enterovibrio norvegicus FF-33]|uniref:Chemotaxis protein CheA n=1 Tax=Enterovibrio norvegicus FF-454 TaxID=1185651 RepID=A0A1E5CAX0_9GAMM|nr:chemotaxis protein CheW [Enterovibrio norvegicus]OEE62626.1 histidine kinase [Enterovibrio norvegicus FF-454]OEE66716.1 histidine kinase [Enterovibrio norvegicus FF-33]OEE86450.1 histidine kinase [Enterovibrio norvegicus FF-162]
MPQSDLDTVVNALQKDFSDVANILSLPVSTRHVKQGFSGLSDKLLSLVEDDPRFDTTQFLIQQTVILLEFLEVDSTEANEDLLVLLDSIIETARSEAAPYSKGDDAFDEDNVFENEHGDDVQQKENMANALNALAIFAIDTFGIDVTLIEDAPVFDDDVLSELDYLSSLIDSNAEHTEPHSDRILHAKNKVKEARELDVQNKFEPTTKVKSHLLEHLMSYSEELVQIRNTLADFAEKQESLALTELSNKLKTVSDGMLNDLLKTQMRPIGNLLSKYRRIVRDLSKELGKKVDVEIVGENIELDSNVIDAINEPLTHLVRNALDHGFETHDIRAASGKSMVGRLLIHAYNEAGKVVINICDDGKGIDREKVLSKALSNGLITQESQHQLTDKEILELIFHPGLSTSDQVNALSGRGVGMDAVKRKVEDIKGTIDIHSEKGLGTEIALIFPLTMATLKVALFDIGNVTYAIPSSDISNIVGISKEEESLSVRFDNGHPLLYQNNKVIPLIEPHEYLGELTEKHVFRRAYQQGMRHSVVVFTHRGQQWGLPVDHVRAFLDIVIKPLDRSMNGNDVFAGAAVLGSGDLALVMNLKKVIQFARSYH